MTFIRPDRLKNKELRTELFRWPRWRLLLRNMHPSKNEESWFENWIRVPRTCCDELFKCIEGYQPHYVLLLLNTLMPMCS